MLPYIMSYPWFPLISARSRPTKQNFSETFSTRMTQKSWYLAKRWYCKAALSFWQLGHLNDEFWTRCHVVGMINHEIQGWLSQVKKEGEKRSWGPAFIRGPLKCPLSQSQKGRHRCFLYKFVRINRLGLKPIQIIILKICLFVYLIFLSEVERK